MDTTTIDILDKALKGDSGALSFLERTSSIYVYDGVNPLQQALPKTYGCWDFLNQALNEMERYEDWMRRQEYQQQQHHHHQREEKKTFDGHMQLLATMSRRAARRSPAADQTLIQICLNNAASSKHPPLALTASIKQQMVDNNTQLRQRVMGRVAAMVFDYNYHCNPMTGTQTRQPPSCFSNAVSIELFCSIVATNAISSGPEVFTNLVQEWIVPSVDTMPPFSIASIAFHLADEAMGKAAPFGTNQTLQNKLYAPIVAKVLTPLLAEAIRESDTSSSSSASNTPYVNHHRIAAMTIRALDKWCTATETGILHVTQECTNQNVNFTEIITDALYSDAGNVMDALAELFETLLRRYETDLKSTHGFHLAASYMQQMQSSFVNLEQTEQMVMQKQSGRDSILSELIAAVSLQRFRFMSCQNRGETAVCQCLARIVTSTAIASESMIRSGRLEVSSLDGMMELLLKAVSHPSLHVSGVALEALPFLLFSLQQQQQQQLAVQLLPILQGRAIIPPSLASATSIEDTCGVDIHEYENFRENLLSDALIACYTSCRSYYVESCSSAVEEFCGTMSSSHQNNQQLQFQLEAALFCLCAVSIDASKRALLHGKSPATQAAAARATANKTPTKGKSNAALVEIIAKQAKCHDDQLSRCVMSLSKNSNFVISNPLTLARACRFCAKYANWISKTPSIGVLDNAAELSLKSFNHTTPILKSTQSSSMNIIEDMRISPITEATTALRNILYRSPSRFATPQALAALRVGWQAAYENANSMEGKIVINDRVTLCSGICRVLAVLPSDQWSSSLIVLAQPTLECLENMTKLADSIIYDPSIVKKKGSATQLSLILTRIAEEIRILSTMTRTFNQTATMVNDNKEITGREDHPIFPFFRQVWSCLTHIAQKLGSYECISNALSDFLTVSVSIKHISNTSSSHLILRDLSEMAATIMGIVTKSKNSSSLVPVLEFVAETIETYGDVAEESAIHVINGSTASAPAYANNIKDIIDRLLYLSFETVHTSLAKGSEQGRGQMPYESSSRMETDLDKKTLDYLSGFFTMLTSCINRCPILLINLRFRFAQEDDGIFERTMDTAVSAVSGKESEVSRSAMVYLKSVILLEHSLRKQDGVMQQGRLSGLEKGLISSSLTKCVASIKRGLVLTLIHGVCGIFQRELVDPAASLLFSVVSTTPSQEAEKYTSEALHQEKFLLGENAAKAILVVLGNCAQGTNTSSILMDALNDVWEMHQSDDAEGTIAKGDVVAKFVKKYGDAS